MEPSTENVTLTISEVTVQAEAMGMSSMQRAKAQSLVLAFCRSLYQSFSAALQHICWNVWVYGFAAASRAFIR